MHVVVPASTSRNEPIPDPHTGSEFKVDVYAYFDGDNIGSRLELLLLDDNVGGAAQYSASVDAALTQTRRNLQNIPSLIVILAGGDDIFVKWRHGMIALSDIERTRSTYEEICGQSLSVGVGLTASRAILNLRRAKLQGKAQLVCEPGSFDDSQGE
ncbi:hypothetical protein JIG36_05565 [Actinoplanes sp. LDG1-06]|uniref:Minimal CRISPR polymerase domain-containing protein n=1 Tax=Paractinoplanes ovalisporus TaxID=2810368 RepID=A0ABS2A5B4_9ACTN|nr:hypothetical protein [Actinoplanes ovalisporus]MBM2615026.1 hypothetical protein [Actinoplanes ovalisporus]